MTMRIAQGEMIGGLPAKEVRDLLRKCGGGFRADWLQDIGMTSVDSANFVSDLLKDGFIEPDKKRMSPGEPACYELTDSGHSLCRALAAKPVSRKSAQAALNAFMDRISIVNEDARFLYRITAVVLYGSYLSGVERPADVDLAIDVERKVRDPKDFNEACCKQFCDSARELRRMGYEFEFARDEVFVFLKQRKRTLSLRSMHDFITMEKLPSFSYEVLLGDKDKIARDLVLEAKAQSK